VVRELGSKVIAQPAFEWDANERGWARIFFVVGRRSSRDVAHRFNLKNLSASIRVYPRPLN
jgi:hypothetical protein